MKKENTTSTIVLFVVCFLQILTSATIAAAQPDDERQFLLMYFREEELVVESPTRSPKPVSQVAENVTVVTARDIELMNAHTLADVLNTVTGVQVSSTGGPGSLALPFIQGSENKHVTVFMDGIPLNNLGDNVADLGTVPVQNIEKIEIIKGPASSAWGSSLGGVVNIITKSGSSGKGTGNMLSASYGEKNTGDFRVEDRVKQDRLSYYLTAGRLQTDGWRPNNDFSGDNVYTKLSYDITEKTNVLLSLGYEKGDRGVMTLPDFSLSNEFDNFRTALSLKTSFGNNTDFSVSVWNSHQIFDQITQQISTGLETKDNYDDKEYGSSAKLTWKSSVHTVVLGTDTDAKTLVSNKISGNEQALRKWAVFVNDTVSMNKLSITPGIRHDYTDTSGDITSPSLGITYSLTDTIFRAYAAKGFSIPPLLSIYGVNAYNKANPDLKMEKVWSYQLGMETAALKYLWLKISGFRNEIRDAISREIEITSGLSMAVNNEKQRRQGVELEVKTAPVYHTSLSAGATYINAKDLNTDQKIIDIPKYTYDLGIQYDDERTFKALLKGRYINWNSSPANEGVYDSFVFDLNMIKSIYTQQNQALEAYLDAHNLSNSSQYAIALFKNPDRWFEAGIRYKF